MTLHEVDRIGAGIPHTCDTEPRIGCRRCNLRGLAAQEATQENGETDYRLEASAQLERMARQMEPGSIYKIKS